MAQLQRGLISQAAEYLPGDTFSMPAVHVIIQELTSMLCSLGIPFCRVLLRISDGVDFQRRIDRPQKIRCFHCGIAGQSSPIGQFAGRIPELIGHSFVLPQALKNQGDWPAPMLVLMLGNSHFVVMALEIVTLPSLIELKKVAKFFSSTLLIKKHPKHHD